MLTGIIQHLEEHLIQEQSHQLQLNGTAITASGSINGAAAAVTGAATIGGTLGVTRNTTLSADLDGVNADFSGTLTVSGDTTVNNLIVNGTSTIASTMSISGGSVDGSVIGGTTPATGSFTDLSATKLTGSLNANDQAITNINVDSGSIDGAAGAISASTASVTSLDIAGDVTVSGSHVRYGS